MQSGRIRDAFIWASSSETSPRLARLSRLSSSKGAWIPKNEDKSSYLQIYLRIISKVTEIELQGHEDQQVTSYSISYFSYYTDPFKFVQNNNINKVRLEQLRRKASGLVV